MNAPTETHVIPDTGIQVTIALNELQPSETNPRKRFDQTRLNELATSIKTQGILQPILVRERSPGRPAFQYEIIAGERRYRAAKIAGLTDVPCVVRNLTDAQVLHAQIVENLQRDDLHPLEEAEGYGKLIGTLDRKGNPYTAESIGAEVGKSTSYIYAKLKLLNLCKKARDLFFSEKLGTETALLIARIPVEKMQIKAMQHITKPQEYNTSMISAGETMTFRAARDHIQTNFMLDLADAPFDTKDEKLLDKVDACTNCPKRTGNQPELFKDVKGKDICTDTVCHAMKRAAHLLAFKENAEAEGHTVITGKEAKKIITNQWYPDQDLRVAGLVKLDALCPNDEKSRTWRQVLNKAKLLKPANGSDKPAIQKTILEDSHNNDLIETVNIEQAVKALRDMGMKIEANQGTHSNSNHNPHPAEQKKLKAKLDAENHYREQLFQTIHNTIKTDLNKPQPIIDPTPLYGIMAKHFLDNYLDFCGADEVAALMAKHYLPDTQEEDELELLGALQAQVQSMTLQQHILLLIDLIMINEIEAHHNASPPPEHMINLASALDIDITAMKKKTAKTPIAKKAADKVTA